MSLPPRIYTPELVAQLKGASMTQAVAIQTEAPPPAVVSESAAIISMIERAARDPSVDVSKFERLMEMSERVEAKAAMRAFNAAVANVKAEVGTIVRNKKGHNDKKYADFNAIASVVDPVLSANGLFYRFRTAQSDRVSVTCILSHRDGHCEESTLTGAPDVSGNKNAIQAIGSTLTYLQRYTLIQSLGIAVADDDDGKASGGATITDDQIETLQALAIEVGADLPKFYAYLKIATLADLPAKDYARAVAALENKRGRK